MKHIVIICLMTSSLLSFGAERRQEQSRVSYEEFMNTSTNLLINLHKFSKFVDKFGKDVDEFVEAMRVHDELMDARDLQEKLEREKYEKELIEKERLNREKIRKLNEQLKHRKIRYKEIKLGPNHYEYVKEEYYD